MIAGLGTIINSGTIVIGSSIGVIFDGRLSERTRNTVTDGLGLVVGVAAVGSIVAIGPDEGGWQEGMNPLSLKDSL